ncbi:MAG TPA: ATP-dependent metallopeptidase FtsH/Yme1/Tma family protein [Dehalococcoidia bacterium]|nr:ATP-dependent metallopeptidase FtsH/Yme1/Tma family protein [Dehalococcoidia bacterium]
MASAPGGPERVSYSQFLEALENKQVAEAQIGESEIRWKQRSNDQWLVNTRIPVWMTAK